VALFKAFRGAITSTWESSIPAIHLRRSSGSSLSKWNSRRRPTSALTADVVIHRVAGPHCWGPALSEPDVTVSRCRFSVIRGVERKWGRRGLVARTDELRDPAKAWMADAIAVE